MCFPEKEKTSIVIAPQSVDLYSGKEKKRTRKFKNGKLEILRANGEKTTRELASYVRDIPSDWSVTPQQGQVTITSMLALDHHQKFGPSLS